MAISRRHPLRFLSGVLIALFVMGLIFGGTKVGFGVLGLAAWFGALLFVFPQTNRWAGVFLRRSEGRSLVSAIIPLFTLAGIFGTPALMLMVLGLAGLVLTFAALRGSRETYLMPAVSPRPPAAAALPAQSSGEPWPTLDLRELCRDLPASAAGQVFATLEHLESAMLRAEQTGDTRRAYDARQGLRDYLPNTVTAWKALPEERREVSELEQALSQVREIAGPNDQGGEASQKAWETQQRFLADKAKDRS